MTAGRRWQTHPRRMAAAPVRRTPERLPVVRTQPGRPRKAGPGGRDTPAPPRPSWSRRAGPGGRAGACPGRTGPPCRRYVRHPTVVGWTWSPIRSPPTGRRESVGGWRWISPGRKHHAVDGPRQNPFLRLVGQALAPDRARRLPEKPEAVHTTRSSIASTGEARISTPWTGKRLPGRDAATTMEILPDGGSTPGLRGSGVMALAVDHRWTIYPTVGSYPGPCADNRSVNRSSSSSRSGSVPLCSLMPRTTIREIPLPAGSWYRQS